MSLNPNHPTDQCYCALLPGTWCANRSWSLHRYAGHRNSQNGTSLWAKMSPQLHDGPTYRSSDHTRDTDAPGPATRSCRRKSTHEAAPPHTLHLKAPHRATYTLTAAIMSVNFTQTQVPPWRWPPPGIASTGHLSRYPHPRWPPYQESSTLQN